MTQIINQVISGIESVRPAPYYAAEIGCADGLFGSYCVDLELRGWNVLCVEANPFYVKKARENRLMVVEAACADYEGEADFFVVKLHSGMMTAMSGLSVDETKLKQHERLVQGQEKIRVPVRKLDSLLEEAKFPRLDLLQIDVEGGEVAVLDGTDLDRWKPMLIQAENWYASEQLRQMMEDRGYEFVWRDGDDDFYARKDVSGRNSASD